MGVDMVIKKLASLFLVLKKWFNNGTLEVGITEYNGWQVYKKVFCSEVIPLMSRHILSVIMKSRSRARSFCESHAQKAFHIISKLFAVGYAQRVS